MKTPISPCSAAPLLTQEKKGPRSVSFVYAHAQHSDRDKMTRMEEEIDSNISRMNDLGATFAFYSSELTNDRDNMATMNDPLRDLRNDMTTSRATGTGDRGYKQVVTGIRGFDKLKIYKRGRVRMEGVAL